MVFRQSKTIHRKLHHKKSNHTMGNAFLLGWNIRRNESRRDFLTPMDGIICVH